MLQIKLLYSYTRISRPMASKQEARQERSSYTSADMVLSLHNSSVFHVCISSICIAAVASFAFCSSSFRLVCAPVNGMDSNVVPAMNAELKMSARFMFSGGFPSGPSRRAFITGEESAASTHEKEDRGGK
jgi:hypothetical protein